MTVVDEYAKYFQCAVDCTSDAQGADCSDCSYSYDDSHEKLTQLKERPWEGYYLGAFGDWFLSDFMAANFTSCALKGKGCITMTQYEKKRVLRDWR